MLNNLIMNEKVYVDSVIKAWSLGVKSVEAVDWHSDSGVIITGAENAEGYTFLFKELPGNKGASVTNVAEILVMYVQEKIDETKKCRFFELDAMGNIDEILPDGNGTVVWAPVASEGGIRNESALTKIIGNDLTNILLHS